jgi:kindlin 2
VNKTAIIMSSGLLKGGLPISDGSWTLTVFVTDLQVERSLRVRGDIHIGGVMIRLVDELGKT